MMHPNEYGPSAGVTVTFRFDPGARATRATVFMSTGINRAYRREDLWRGMLPVTVEDLRGLSRRDVALVLAAGLHEYWEAVLLAESVPQEPAEGAGAPLGATGGTVTQDTLPGL